MSEAGETKARRPKGARLRQGLLLFALVLVVMAGALGIVGMSMTGRVIALPDWVVARIEDRADKALGGAASARILAVDLLVDETYVPHVRLTGVELFSPRGARIAVLPEVETTLKARPILSGRVEPRRLSLAGARVALRRLPDGSLDIDMGSDAAAGMALGPVEMLNRIDEAFALPVLRDIESVVVDGLDISFSDSRSGRTWNATDGEMILSQNASRIGLDIAMTLAEAGRQPAKAALSFSSTKGSTEASLTAQVTDVSARDLAAQSPALAVLGALDAPISGSITSSVGADGQFGALSATLEIGQGALQPTPGTRPVPFDTARLSLSYDPASQRIDFSEITLDSPALLVVATAKSWLKGMDDGLPDAMVGQIEISDLKADPAGVFADPVELTEGAMDFRLRFDPFSFDLGQLVLLDGETGRIAVKGAVNVEPEGWAVAMDANVNAIESDRLLALWPVSAVPKTRLWLTENVATSYLYDVHAALRLGPGQEPVFSLGYEFRDTEVRVIKTLPPIRDGAGYSTISDNAYTLVVDRGHIIAPSGGRIDMAGSVMRIPDLRIKPAPARFTLRTDSTIPAALSLLDQPPFLFLTKSGRGTDLAEGRAEVEAELQLVLKKKLQPGEVEFDVDATLSDVTSDKIAPGRVLTADKLKLRATNDELRVFGPARFDGLPVEAEWRQGLTPADKGKSRVEAKVELSPRFLETFSITLPPGAVSGTGSANLEIELEKGKAPRFLLTSGLEGIALRLPEIGWSKGPGQWGKLLVRGRLGKPVEVERLELEGAGLEVAGNLELAPDGGLVALRLGTASLSDWFRGSLELQGRGRGRPPAIVINSGSVDLTRARFGKGSGGGTPLTVALDRLQISQGIALTGFRGSFTTAGGLAGSFGGRINGGTELRGTAEPAGGGTAFRVRSVDAGAALREAGIYANGVGGALDLTLRGTGQQGNYTGSARIENIRVVGASALAELLNAVSVVGLLDQLNGPGILFTTVVANLRLTPNAVEIRNAAATGPSLGVSAEGVYRSSDKRIDLQGTISPIYALNAVGQIFSRRGEGLFGFNYRMVGPASNPQISVNPLSILTPGMFREIFRSAPPAAGQ